MLSSSSFIFTWHLIYTAANREPDQSLPDQLTDAAKYEEERRWLADTLDPE